MRYAPNLIGAIAKYIYCVKSINLGVYSTENQTKFLLLCSHHVNLALKH